MVTDGFIKEVVSFVKLYCPYAKWEIGKYDAVLQLDDGKRTICFSVNPMPDVIQNAKHNYYITSQLWNKNKEALKSRLCSLMGVTKRIHARQCLIKKITKAEARIFVDLNHTMGYAEANFNCGLFFKDELVAVACFSKGRRMNRLPADKRSFELIRFCNKNFYTVVGGLSKLIRYFEETHSPGDIMTYIDRSWGEPNAYYALGFVLDKNAELMNNKNMEHYRKP